MKKELKMDENIKFDKTEEFIYEMISKRFKAKKNYYKLKNYEILSSDPQLASNILNNKRSPKKNPYLITSTYLIDIQNNLHFETMNEMLWGKEDEFITYSGRLFYLLINEILASESSIKTVLESLLIDYAPFAKNKCYEDFIENEGENTWPWIYHFEWNINSQEKEVIYYNAIGRLYFKIQFDFINSYLGYFNDKDIIKLNKKLNEFVQNNLLSIFNKEYSNINDSIGKLVYTSLNAYFLNTPSESEYILYLPGNYHNTCTPETEEDVVVVLDDLRKLCLNFVDELIKIQNRLEFSSYEGWLENDSGECDFM